MSKMCIVKTKRFNVEIDEETYKQLKSLLALQGVTISQWVRLCIKIYLQDNKEEEE